MMIKQVGCDQFAGIQLEDGGIKFDRGLNLVVGDNESGKSTMADLLFYMLFKDSKLDGRSDAAFMDKYFPKNANGPKANFIDGMLVFETDAGTYKLKKEWDKGEGTCRLTLPGGTMIKGTNEINEVLAKELKHRAGVYDQIVFATQKRKTMAVQSIMQELSKKQDAMANTRKDLLSVLTKASLETGGVAIEKLEAKLREKLDELAFRWDFEANTPEKGRTRGIDNKWSGNEKRDCILRAYYEMEETKRTLETTRVSEEQVDKYKKELLDWKAEKQSIEDERTEFQKYRSILAQRKNLSDLVSQRAQTIKEEEDALAKWPRIVTNVATARQLLNNRAKAETRALYLRAKDAQQRVSDCKDALSKKKTVQREEIRRADELLRQEKMNEGKLSGMNVVAKIQKLGEVPVQVRSLSSGEALSDTDGQVRIGEASVISIPDVAEITLLPEGVDVETIKQDLENARKELNAIFQKYGVKKLGELEKLSEEYEQAQNDFSAAQTALKAVLGEHTWEDLERDNLALGDDVEPLDAVERKLSDLCGAKSPESYIGGLDAMLESYENKYESIGELAQMLSDLQKKQAEETKKLESAQEVPEKYIKVSEPDAYDEELQNKIKECDNYIQQTDNSLRNIERELSDKTVEEYEEELKEKAAVWEEKKNLYARWHHIYEVFCRVKETTGGNPVNDLEDKFREYLSLLSDGAISLNSFDEEMSVQLTSGKYELTYDTLSEGTEDAIALAFRLAMLEHLYPDGEGLAVFDDPFTDMDEKRVAEACKLVQKFAENNQVIFITCDSKYQSLLSGNVVQMRR